MVPDVHFGVHRGSIFGAPDSISGSQWLPGGPGVANDEQGLTFDDLGWILGTYGEAPEAPLGSFSAISVSLVRVWIAISATAQFVHSFYRKRGDPSEARHAIRTRILRFS